MDNKYTCDYYSKMHSVRTEDMNDAARIFADRIAQRTYGRSAYCATCNQNSYGTNSALYQAFIGVRSAGSGCMTGTNIWFTVSHNQ